MPRSVTHRAAQVLQQLLLTTNNNTTTTSSNSPNGNPNYTQQAQQILPVTKANGEEEKDDEESIQHHKLQNESIAKILEMFEPDELTPRQALDKLFELKQQILGIVNNTNTTNTNHTTSSPPTHAITGKIVSTSSKRAKKPV